MNRITKQPAARIAAIALLSVVIAGCQSQIGGISPQGQPARNSAGQAVDASGMPDSPQQAFNQQTKKSGGQVPVVSAAAENGKSEVEGAKMNPPSSGKTAKEPAAPSHSGVWNPQAPRLRGIALGTISESDDKRLGKPDDSYIMQDENGDISVKEYGGYSVGIRGGNRVVFVDVFGKEADPMLSGIRIGDGADSAVKAIGKPDSRTSSVITYKGKDAMLKLDLDPDKNAVMSIKLFALSSKP